MNLSDLLTWELRAGRPQTKTLWKYFAPVSRIFYSSFSLSLNKHGTQKWIRNRPGEEAKKMKCYKRLKYKQFVQITGLCGPQLLSYLPKHFTHLCRALYRDAILVDQQKHLEFTFPTKALPFHSRASIREHKHIF